MYEIKKISNEEMLNLIDTAEPRGLFYSEKEEGGFVACDNRTGDAWVEEFKTFKGCKAYLEEDESCQCWSCSMTIESYVCSHTITLKSGEEIVVSDLISEDDKQCVEEEAREKYGDDFESIDFGDYCPHCLACM